MLGATVESVDRVSECFTSVFCAATLSGAVEEGRLNKLTLRFLLLFFPSEYFPRLRLLYGLMISSS